MKHRTPASILHLLVMLPMFVYGQVSDFKPESLRKIDVIEHLGETIPGDIPMLDAEGKMVQLSQYLNQGRPLIVAMAYYECPMLCTMVLNGLAKSVNTLEWHPGEEFQILTVSIDPDETAELARGKEDVYRRELGENPHPEAWKFHVSDTASINRLADALGFVYYYDEDQDEFAHPAVLMVLTADGTISRYLYGLEPSTQDLKFALLEASEGKIGNTLDRLLLYCYHYDSQAGTYSVQAANVMRLGGLVTVMVLGFVLGILFWHDRTSRSQVAAVSKEKR